jgi:hypothetical protein
MKANGTKQAWLIGWLVAFLGFPIGGYIAFILIGRMDTAVDGIFGGAVAGALIGAAQFVALHQRLPMSWRWIAMMSVGLALGVGLSAALFGTAMTPEVILPVPHSLGCWWAAHSGSSCGSASSGHISGYRRW